ncbi:kynurenine formamidase [Microplitis mediator]|uniref:kynurenine formamidase n=1 Tax=Microplitis mediator TaxID=375433 RepID=UPI00255708F3|nr:kynurenine formamidase [Microplitis mediator]
MAIDPEHEKAYSPGAWSKKYTEGYEEFLEISKRATIDARNSIPCKLDIAYGPTELMKYDYYGTNLPNDAPVLIFIHGGYWQECSKEMAGFHIKQLVSKGIKVFNLGYNLCPQVTLSNLVTETRTGIEEILKVCRKMGCKGVWVAGHSAGAHLAASLLYDREWLTAIKQSKQLNLLKGLILIAGIYSLEPVLTTSFNQALKLTDHEVKTLSFNTLDMSKVEAVNNIKVIAVVGEKDAPVFVKESKNYSKRLIEFVDQVEFVLLRDMIDHFDIIENLRDPNYLLTKIIINNIMS